MKQNKIPRNEYIRKPVGKTNPYKDDVIYSNLGQWKYPGQVTRIPSGDITMQGVPYPVYGEDNLGYSQMMYPGMDYQFPGQYVTEIPMAQKGIEHKVNTWLGEPMKKAQEASAGEKWYNPKTKKWEQQDDIDNLRHPMAGRFTTEAIANKFPNWMQYTGVPQAVGFLGSTALGVGHELTSNKYTNPEGYANYSFWDSISEAGEDAFNNMIGAATGALPISDSKKTQILQYLSDNNLLPDGYANSKANMYFKKAYGGVPMAQKGGYNTSYKERTNLPIIEDAGSFNEENVWIPDWEAITEQAKKLGAKTVKTKSGVIINFDKNWQIKNVDDNPITRYGGDPSLPDITGHYPFGGQNTKTHTHMSKGGWLDEYQYAGTVSDKTRVQKTRLTPEKLSKKAQENTGQDQKNFLAKWNNSSMAQSMLQKSVDKDDPWGINASHVKNITDARNQMLKTSDVNVKPFHEYRNTLKKDYKDRPRKHDETAAPDMGISGYTTSNKKDRLEDSNFFTFAYSLLSNPSNFINPFTYQDGPYYLASQINPNYKNRIETHNEHPTKSDLPGIIVHELSHASDAGGKLIPVSDKDKMYKYSHDKKLNEFDNYIANPTETRARLNDFRYRANNQNIYDPFNQKIKLKDLEKYKRTEDGLDPLSQLETIYTDEEIIDLLNSVSKNNEKNNANSNLAKYGGWLNKYQMRGEKLPSETTQSMVPAYMKNLPKSIKEAQLKQKKINEGKAYEKAIQDVYYKYHKDKADKGSPLALGRALALGVDPVEAKSKIEQQNKNYAATTSKEDTEEYLRPINDEYLLEKGLEYGSYLAGPEMFEAGTLLKQGAKKLPGLLKNTLKKVNPSKLAKNKNIAFDKSYIPEQTFKTKKTSIYNPETKSYDVYEIDVPQEVIPGRSYEDVKHKMKSLRKDLGIGPVEHLMSKTFGSKTNAPSIAKDSGIWIDPQTGKLFDSNTRYWLNREYGNIPKPSIDETYLAKNHGRLIDSGLPYEEAESLLKSNALTKKRLMSDVPIDAPYVDAYEFTPGNISGYIRSGKGKSLGYEKGIEMLQKMSEEYPVLAQTSRIPTFYHGTTSASIPGMLKGEGLIPTGQLIKRGEVPFTGELFSGVTPSGINQTSLSTVSARNHQPALDYANAMAREKIDVQQKLQDWFTKGGRDEYIKDFANSPYFPKAEFRDDLYNKRLTQWNALSDEEKAIIQENYPIMIGINPRQGDASRFIYPNSRISNEVGISGNIGFDEIPSIFAPTDKIQVLQKYLGNKTKVLPIEDFSKSKWTGIDAGYKHGGWLNEYQKKGEVREPIYVSDKNDPKLKSYNDSLALYNLSQKAKKLFDANPVDPTLMDYNKKADALASKSKIEPTKLQLSGHAQNYPRDFDPAAMEEPWMVTYKKPVQPYIYKKPEEKEESRIVVYTDKAAFDKAYKAEMDSLNVRKVYDQSFKPGSKTRPLTKEEKEYWKDKKTGLVPNLVEYDPRYPNAGYFGHFKKPVIHNVYKEEPPPPPVKKKDKPKEKGLPPGVIRQWNFNSNVGPVMIYKKGDQEVGREYYRDGKPYETHYGDPTGKTTIDTIPFDPARIKKEGGWLDDEEFRRGGPYTPPKLKRKVKKQGTSKNIQSSINKIFTRNYDVFGPGGKNIYNPNVYKTGGWLDNLD